MTKYLIIVNYPLGYGGLEFYIGETNAEIGTEGFEDFLEEYQHNTLSGIIAKEINEKLIKSMEDITAEMRK